DPAFASLSDTLQKRACSYFTLPANRLSHGRQRWINVATEFDTVETNHRQLTRHAKAVFSRKSQQPHTHEIVASEYGCNFDLFQQSARGFVPPFCSKVTPDNPLGAKRRAGFSESFSITVEAISAHGRGFGPGNATD